MHSALCFCRILGLAATEAMCKRREERALPGSCRNRVLSRARVLRLADRSKKIVFWNKNFRESKASDIF
jgi:hypothetical protein